MLFLKILGGLVTLGIGLYMGLAGQYRPDHEEIDKALGPYGRSRKTKRRFTLFGWMRVKEERASHARRRGGPSRRFDMVVPKTPEERGK